MIAVHESIYKAHLHKVDETLHGMKQIISYPQKIPSKKPISTTRTFR